jgi:hypothetical protein
MVIGATMRYKSRRHSSNDYGFYNVPNTLPNVVYAVGKAYIRDGIELKTQCVLDPLRKLLVDNAGKNPSFIYEAKYCGTGIISDFNVYEGDNWVGFLGMEGFTPKLRVGSLAIAEKMSRRFYRETKDVATAHKWACSIMSKSLGDCLSEAGIEVRQGIHMLHRKQESKWSDYWYAIRPFLMQYVSADPDLFIAHAKAIGGAESLQWIEALEAIPALESYKNSAYDLTNRPNTTSVLLHNGVYVVEDMNKVGTQQYTVYSHGDNLPAQLRRGLGLLKLLPDDSMLEGVGYKLDCNKYLIYNRFLASAS